MPLSLSLPLSPSLSLSLSLSPRPGVRHTDGRRPTVVRASGQSDLRTAGAAASLSLTANLDAKGGERLAVAEPWTITDRYPQRVYPNCKSVCPPTGSHAQISANSNEDRPTSAGTKAKVDPSNGPHTTMPTALRGPIGPDGAAVPMVGVRVRRQTAFSRIQDNLACLSRATHTL
ncbi:hypothetical protein CH63R_07745 [Colletotrichum higginsianum IMI 349063]|uniref:Uncharacterized protein n=1 Tax=Colletotrichum higginsianum (strain IMI 349063) TaxID=759273 RepID=A0A1B7YAS4_COLHI|nr:hypothetical protein CH63R_07745 [Colletotrichum higginsianum IMI 349063]OBR08980.1 hypothetical protein CH63R_07745 [Colletotrichum higginsianum IMI 349063]